MPISAIDGCTEEHWVEVREILTDAIESAGFSGCLVSDSDEVGVIQKRIIHNLYENPIVVCDVSAKNPNVMFELGLRLAFDKPTIIVKDDKTQYSFDTSPIEHVSYPRDLRFAKVVGFKQALSEKIVATHRAATSDSHYTTFLKHFGTFHVAKLESKEVSAEKLILEELSDLRKAVLDMRRRDHERIRVGHDSPEVLERIRNTILEVVSSLGLRSKQKIREAKTEIVRLVEQSVEAPRHFSTRRAYEETFEFVFSMMYG